jgi:undecaprenyl diphosphate synthase
MTQSSLPQHIAVIMDGNGRWAKQRFMPRVAGHRAGLESAREIVKQCVKHKIKVLSLFAFSSENWRRPQQEVSYLMELLLTGLEREVDVLHKQQVQLRFIGDRSRFSETLRNKIQDVERLTALNSGLVLIIAADYGGQWDICEAAKAVAREVSAGQIKPDDITPQHLARHLSFSDLPDPDLFIRTSGELRISNYMLWQLAYAELYFTSVLWPDFNAEEFEKALVHYARRERRFGYCSEQLTES